MSKAYDDFKVAFDRLLHQVGVADAMQIATSIFVSLVVHYTEHKGYDSNKQITINGGNQRDITIHAPKARGAAKKSLEAISQAGYEVFRANMGRAYPNDKAPLPWHELNPETRQSWIAAAQTMADEVRQIH